MHIWITITEAGILWQLKGIAGIKALLAVIYLDWSDLERPDGSRLELDVEPLLLLVERTGFEAFRAPDLYHIW